MALWQYTYYVIPRESIQDLSDLHLLSTDTEEGFDLEGYWKTADIPVSFFDSLSTILPLGQSWSEDIVLFGNQQSHMIQVIQNEYGKVEDVSIRIDFTRDYDGFLSEFLEFCIHRGLVILDEEMQISPLSVESIRRTIEASPQSRQYYRMLDSGTR